ncbi:hypothetical protein CDAR_380451 [Caerostris darwini]|uniref:Uncharacterized protein n=1 Tax=Caerostris darwini TaxID=1538125 RepID=A0AAV4TLH2_9ARAC|nr:hypothetical protein CDAR_380451 [Caerostris darwini]
MKRYDGVKCLSSVCWPCASPASLNASSNGTRFQLKDLEKEEEKRYTIPNKCDFDLRRRVLGWTKVTLRTDELIIMSGKNCLGVKHLP